MRLSTASSPVGFRAPAYSKSVRDLRREAIQTRTPQDQWIPGEALSKGCNAHRTNTVQQMQDMLAHGGHNWLEGDVRGEINKCSAPEMRHDPGQEVGDNLSLGEWLHVCNASGRGVKLDIKEPSLVPSIMEQVKREGIPEGKLMFNLGYSGMKQYGPAIRHNFPNALLGLNPPARTDGKTGPLSDSQVNGFLQQARALQGPVTFVVKKELLSPSAVSKLEGYAPVSVWTDQASKDPARDAAALRKMGVTGIVDIPKDEGVMGKVKSLWDKARGRVSDFMGAL